MLETVRQVAQTDVDGIKIHQLCIYRGTPMEKDFLAGTLPVLDEDEYVQLIADALELLPPEMVIMRLVAEGVREEIIAPQWTFEKERVMEKIDAELTTRGTRQGSRYGLATAACSIPNSGDLSSGAFVRPVGTIEV
jgi:hypothetical protein